MSPSYSTSASDPRSPESRSARQSLDELIGELLQGTLAEYDSAAFIDKRNFEEFERLSGQGNSLGATFNR